MTFMWPQFLWLLPVVPLLVLVYGWLSRRKKKLVLRYASVAIVKQAMGAGMGWRRHLPPVLFLLAITALLIAAARPLAVITLSSNQKTIVLAVDVSLSLSATDVKPNRMVAAQAAARAFLHERPKSVSVAIVTFAGSAQLVQPATLNREDLMAAIDRFQLQRGTAIGSGIVVSLAELFPAEGIDLGEITYGKRLGGVSLDEKPKAARIFLGRHG
jgi:Ca-activated chloride channel family protein